MGNPHAKHGMPGAGDVERRSLSADRLKDTIRVALASHPSVESVHDVDSVHLDRLSIDAIDRSQLAWRVTVMRQPRSVGGRR